MSAENVSTQEKLPLVKRPGFWGVVIVAGIIWGISGFPPIGFPTGEYVCTAKSGVQEHPISMFHPKGGPPMKVIEYRPGEAVDITPGMSFTHSTFSRELNLYLNGESYHCSLE